VDHGEEKPNAVVPGGQCYFANESEPYYFDGDDLSDVGAMRIMPLFFKLLEGHSAGGERFAELVSTRSV
jgi:hypothetical protein